jgi:predicted small secreted protein
MFAAHMKLPLVIPRLVVLACCLTLASCGTMSKLWPFGKKTKQGPEAVNELQLVNADGTPVHFPQYWSRNTLIIDLSGASGSGSIAARLPPDTTWPVRMAVRVFPRAVHQVEILGEERNVLPVTSEGTKSIELPIGPSVYTPRTAALYISWGPMPVFAEAAPPTAEPGFVSPTVAPPASGSPPAPNEPADDPATPSASEIIPPGAVEPAQPPPGS